MNFHFGKPSNKQLIIVSIVLSTLVASLSQCMKVEDKYIWDLIDEVQRKYFPNGVINRVIIQDPDKLNRRVERDVDKAIRDYERLTGDDGTVRMPLPRYSEKPVDTSVCYTSECQSLGGEMRLCAPWALDCSPESVVK